MDGYIARMAAQMAKGLARPSERDRGTYTLDVWIPKGERGETETKGHVVKAAATDGPIDMDIDAVMDEHCLVPVSEWREYMGFRNSQSTPVFARPT